CIRPGSACTRSMWTTGRRHCSSAASASWRTDSNSGAGCQALRVTEESVDAGQCLVPARETLINVSEPLLTDLLTQTDVPHETLDHARKSIRGPSGQQAVLLIVQEPRPSRIVERDDRNPTRHQLQWEVGGVLGYRQRDPDITASIQIRGFSVVEQAEVLDAACEIVGTRPRAGGDDSGARAG